MRGRDLSQHSDPHLVAAEKQTCLQSYSVYSASHWRSCRWFAAVGPPWLQPPVNWPQLGDTRRHPTSNSGSGKLTDTRHCCCRAPGLIRLGLRNSLSMNSSHWDNKLSKINDNWHSWANNELTAKCSASLQCSWWNRNMWGHCFNYRSHIACLVTEWHCVLALSCIVSPLSQRPACELCLAGFGPQCYAMEHGKYLIISF